PIDFVIYNSDSLEMPEGRRIDESDDYFNQIRRQWSKSLRNILVELPEYPDNYWNK
ncbi:MAG: peptidase, partial [Psychrobacter sp.]